MRVRFTAAAEQELAQAAEYYESVQNELGACFLDEVEATVARIATHPLAWNRLSARTRRCRTHRFPYGLFYQVRDQEILILSAMDLRRDPRRWKKLL